MSSYFHANQQRCTTLATWFLDENGKVVRIMQHHALGNGPADSESIAAADALIEHMTSDEQDFSQFHAWRKSRQNVAEDFNVQTLTYQISSLAVKASVPELLEVGMKCLKEY